MENVRPLRDRQPGDEARARWFKGAADPNRPNGSQIFKGAMRKGDATKPGTCGYVLASHGPVYDPYCGETHFAYFVEWEDAPGLPVFVAGCADRVLDKPPA